MIRLGFEVKTGNPVDVEPVHLGAAGITREAGKTTALEALAYRSGETCLVIRTKLGEGENTFKDARKIPLFFKSRSDWQYVESLLSTATRENQKWNRSFIRWVCRNTHNDLNEVWANVKKELAKQKQGSFLWSIYYNLDAYFEMVVPQLKKFAFSTILELAPGTVSVMDLEPIAKELPIDAAEALQSLFIRATLDEIFERHENTIVILPEAATFLAPGKAVTPVSAGAERIVRQGGVRGIRLWIDSQDVVGVVTGIRGQISTWLLGKQAGGNQAEVKRSLDLLTLPKEKMITPDEIQTLELGQFYLVKGKEVRKVYVWPAWMPEESARDFARTGKAQLISPVRATAQPRPEQPVDKFLEMASWAESIENRVHELETLFKNAKVSGISTGDGTITRQEEVWTVKDSQPVQKTVTTASHMGRLVYALIVDLDGGPATDKEIHDASLEHGWPTRELRFVNTELFNAAKQGLLVRDPDKRWRTPNKVRLITEEAKA